MQRKDTVLQVRSVGRAMRYSFRFRVFRNDLARTRGGAMAFPYDLVRARELPVAARSRLAFPNDLHVRAKGFERHNTRANIGGFQCICYAGLLCFRLSTSAMRVNR